MRTRRNRVIVLFTDGENNRGRDPVEVLRESQAAGIRVHMVGVESAVTVALLVYANGRARSVAADFRRGGDSRKGADIGATGAFAYPSPRARGEGGRAKRGRMRGASFPKSPLTRRYAPPSPRKRGEGLMRWTTYPMTKSATLTQCEIANALRVASATDTCIR